MAKLDVLAFALGIDSHGFKSRKQFIDAFIRFDSNPTRLNHDRIGRLYVDRLNRACLSGTGSARKMLENIKLWVLGKLFLCKLVHYMSCNS